MNKASGGDGIPVELFQIVKDGAVKVLHSICQQIRKTQQWPQEQNRSVFIPIPKNVETTEQLHSVQFSSVVQLYLTLCDPMDRSTPCLHVNHQLLEYLTCQKSNAENSPSEAAIVHEPRISRCSSQIQKRQKKKKRKGRRTRDQIANIRWIIGKAREFQKNIYFCFNNYIKAFDCVDHNKLWSTLKEMGIPDHLTCFMRNLYAGQEAIVGTMDQF